jgi:hypothetical protein
VWFHRGAVSKRFVLEECGLKEMWAREKVLNWLERWNYINK